MNRLATMLALLLCLALLAGCGAAGPSPASETPLPAAEPETPGPETERPATETELPAPEPESHAPDQDGAFGAYLEHLEEKRESILSYNWQKGFGWDEDFEQSYYNPGTVNVAFADVWGDSVPELIYLAGDPSQSGEVYSATLHVFGWSEGALRELFTELAYDVQAGGGMIYRLFRVPGERALWIYTNHLSEENDQSYRCLSVDGDELRPEHTFRHLVRYDWETDATELRCTIDGQEVTESEYQNAIPAEALQAAGLLLRNLEYQEYSSDALSVYPPDGAGMTVDAAISYLKAALGLTELLEAEAFYENLPSFWFSSGAGGWGTELSFNADGSALLSFHDSDMGVTGEGYPYGTVYTCTCRVFFSQPERINDYVYRATVTDMDLDGPEVGEEWIEDGVRYIYSTPYGLENAYIVYFYAPGAPTTELPREFMRWIASPRAWGSDWPLTLPCWGLYSVEDQTGFSGE